jgi:hypothetical protein
MSCVSAVPEAVSSAASDLSGIGSAIRPANSAAAASTTGRPAAGADEVSAAITTVFASHVQTYQALSSQISG